MIEHPLDMKTPPRDGGTRFRGPNRSEPMHRFEIPSMEHLRQLLEATPEGIVSLDPAGRCTFVNAAATRLLGYSADELHGQEFHALIHHSQADRTPIPRHESPIQRTLASQQGCRVSNEVFWRADGTFLAVEYAVTPLAERGAVNGVVVSFRDISEHRWLEERFRQSQKMEPLGRLASGVTHDFNNLLTIISGYSEILFERLKGDAASRELIVEIQKAQDRAAALTRQLLAFTRQQTPCVRPIQLNSIIQDISNLLRRLIGENIEIASCLACSLGRVRADVSQLEQVLLNLAINARDAMPNGGKITLETANVELDEAYARAHPDVNPGPYVLMSVADTGCGMSPDVLAHLFEPFFTTKEPGKGTGLGLSTVAGIVKNSGGHIRVFSEPGRGTTFKIYLPRFFDDSARPAGSGFRGGETILLVEDDPGVCGLVQRILAAKGYAVLHARDLREARQLMEMHAGTIDLFLGDVELARTQGRSVLHLLSARHPGVKSLFISGYPGGMILNPGETETVTAILQKPFSTETLTRKIREVLDQ